MLARTNRRASRDLAVSVGIGACLATAAALWFRTTGWQQVTAPSWDWFLAQVLRGPGFLVGVGDAGVAKDDVVMAIAAFICNFAFYTLGVFAALAVYRVIRHHETCPTWLPYAAAFVILGLNVWEQQIAWVCDAGADLLSSPPVGVVANFAIALPGNIPLLAVAALVPSVLSGDGNMLLFDAFAAFIYGVVGHVVLKRRAELAAAPDGTRGGARLDAVVVRGRR